MPCKIRNFISECSLLAGRFLFTFMFREGSHVRETRSLLLEITLHPSSDGANLSAYHSTRLATSRYK